MPSVGVSQYDTVDYVMRLARAMVNDAQTNFGNLLSNSSPFSQTFLNAGYRDLQDALMNSGVENYAKETVIYNLAPVPGSALDPAIQTQLSFTGYFDGVSMHANTVLPSDMVTPLVLWERQTTGNQAFMKMAPCNDGLPSRSKGSRLYEWDWHDDQIFLIGATQAVDLRLRYSRYYPELVLNNNPPDQVRTRRADRALAAFVAYRFALARGAPAADTFFQMATTEISSITNQTARRKQRGNHRSIPYSANSHDGWGV